MLANRNCSVKSTYILFPNKKTFNFQKSPTSIFRFFPNKGLTKSPFNFGPQSDDAQPVEWIAKQLAEKWGNGASWQVDVGNHPHEANYLKLDISKAAHQLNWHPTMRLDKALSLTVDWAQEMQKGYDMRSFTQSQIQTYQHKALPDANSDSNCPKLN